MPRTSEISTSSSSQEITYGLCDLEQIDLSVLLSSLDKGKKKASRVVCIDKIEETYLLLSHNGVKQTLTVWDSRLQKMLFNEEVIGIYKAARFLPIKGLLLCQEHNSSLIVIDTNSYKIISNGVLERVTHHTVISKKNRVQLIAYESDLRRIKFINLNSGRLNTYRQYDIESFFPENTDYNDARECLGICSLPGEKTLIALCLLDSAQGKGFIRLLELNLFSNEVIFKECIEIPNIISPKDKCQHDRGIFCMPDGRLVYAANYYTYPKVPTIPLEYDNLNKILIFTPTVDSWVFKEETIIESPRIYTEDWDIFPYVLKDRHQKGVSDRGELVGYIPKMIAPINPPEEWRILFSLRQNHTFYRANPDSPYQYTLYKVAAVDVRLLKNIFGEKMAELYPTIPMPLSDIIFSYALDIGMFSNKDLKKQVVLWEASDDRFIERKQSGFSCSIL